MRTPWRAPPRGMRMASRSSSSAGAGMEKSSSTSEMGEDIQPLLKGVGGGSWGVVGFYRAARVHKG